MSLASVGFMVPRPPKTRPGAAGINLRRIRDGQKLSQRRLAAKSGVHYVTIANIESGSVQEPDTSTLTKLANALSVRIGDLLEEGQVERSDDLVTEYLKSPWAQIDKPSDEELDWLRALPGVVFLGAEPSAEAVHHLLEARRRSRSK